MKISRRAAKLLPTIAALGAASCGVGMETSELPPPCAPDVAARARADSTTVQPPAADILRIPPELPSGTGPVRVYLRVGVDGRVVPGTARVTGTDDPRAVRRLSAWAASLRFRPATYEGCGIEVDTQLMVSMDPE